MKRECESCIKRKTPYCPISIECMATDDMPYYQNRIMLLEENKKQKEVIDRILNETKETRNIINNNRDDNMLSKGCLLSYLEIVEDLLKEVSE